METKKCTKCGELKPFSDYGKAKLGKFGLRAICKHCKFIQDKSWAQINRKSRCHSSKKYAVNNPIKVAIRKRNWEKNNPEAHKAIKDRWSKNYPEQKRSFANAYRQRSVISLSDPYVKDKLERQGVPITPETIALKRKQLTLVRTIKNLENETN